MSNKGNHVIGIITINDTASNYGNRLQNYALQELLKSYGNPETIQHFLEIKSKRSLIKAKIRLFASVLKKFVLGHVRNPWHLEYRRRWEEFMFTKRFIGIPSMTVSQNAGFDSKGKTVDLIVLGSDQIWNDRHLQNGDLAIRLGAFMPGRKVVSYAASFGVDQVKENHKAIYAKYLARLAAVGVREFRGQELVQELAGRGSKVVLDPTLMLNADDWRRIERNFVNSSDRYVLTYFLGGISEARRKAMEDFASARGCRLRNLLDKSDAETYVAGPQDFVELFDKAEYVFTDSYHACCFSLIFSTPFQVLSREGIKAVDAMNSRMETLFKQFALPVHITDEISEYSTIFDFCAIHKRIHEQQDYVRTWLNDLMSDLIDQR